jgi:serine/threonine protein kinase
MPEAPLIGSTLGHYEITALLGKGGMGEVYRARDARLDRDIALEVWPTEMANDPARLERFSRVPWRKRHLRLSLGEQPCESQTGHGGCTTILERSDGEP